MSKSKKCALILVCLLMTVCCAFALNACGGTSYTVRFYDGDVLIQTLTGKDNDALTPPKAPEKDGYIFDAWTDAEGNATEPSSVFNGNADYYAKYAVKRTITLDADGGTTDVSSVAVKDGSDLYDAIKDIVPKISDGTVFGNWFLEDEEISANGTAVNSDLTVKAHYKAGYTVNVYKEKIQNRGEYDHLVVKGNAYVGETLTPVPSSVEGYYVFHNEEGEVDTAVIKKNASENLFTFRYILMDVSVVFDANEPEGKTAYGDTENKEVVPTIPFDAPNGYTIEGYRFAGWSFTSDGKAEFLPDEQVTVSSAAVLYAVWDEGYVDGSGGLDVVFVTESESKAYLQRKGFPEKEGTYNPETRLFTFVTDSEAELIGRISQYGHTFSYLKDNVNQLYYVYNSYDWYPTLETMELKTFNDAVLTAKDGTTTEGSYRLDPVTGDYKFTADDGEERYFELSVSYSSRKNVCTFRGEEVGLYYYFDPTTGNIDRNRSIMFDGYGYGIYTNRDRYGDTGYLGRYRYTDAEAGDIFFYVIITDDDNTEVDVYCRLTEIAGVKVYYNGDMMKFDLKRQVEIGAEQKEETIKLDGFGNATYTAYDGKVITGGYDFDFMTYTLTITYDGGSIAFSVDLANGTFDTVDENCGVYWWYRGTIYSVLLVIDGTGRINMYANSENGTIAFVTGSYEPTDTDGVYRFVIAEDGWLAEVSGTMFEVYFEDFEFRLGEHNLGENHFDTFTLRFEGLGGFTLETTDGGKIVLDEFSGATYTKDNVETIGFYDYFNNLSYKELRVYTNTTSYAFVTFPYEGDGWTFYQYIETYVSYHNFLPYDYTLSILSDGRAVVTDTETGINIIYGSYLASGDGYDFKIDKVYDNHNELSDTFHYIIRKVNGEDCAIIRDSKYRLVFNAETDQYGSLRFDEYGYAHYRSAGMENEVECEYIMLMENVQLRETSGDRTYQLVLLNMYEGEGDISFKSTNEDMFFYFLDGFGLMTPDHFLLERTGGALSGTGKYYRYSMSGGVYTDMVEKEAVWSLENGIFSVSYDGMKVDFIEEKRYSEWAEYSVIIETTKIDPDKIFEYEVLAADKETVVGTLYHDGYSLHYRDESDGSVYDASVMTEGETYIVISLQHEAGENEFLTFDYIDGDKEKLWLRGSEGGSGAPFEWKFYLQEYGTRYLGTYMTFDGHGTARYAVTGSDVVEGTYVADGDGYIFTADGVSFRFKTAYVDNGYNVFRITHERYGGDFTNPDWISLELDLYAAYAVYTDRYGYVYEGIYRGLSDTAVMFEAEELADPLYFRLNKQEGSFSIITDSVLVEDNHLVIFISTESEIRIPDGVKEIPDSFFKDNDFITSVDLNQVETVGEQAFYSCDSLKTVLNGGNLTEIKAATFRGCVSLEEIDLSNVRIVGEYAFYDTKLKNVNLAAIEEVGYLAFCACTGSESFVIGQNIRIIGNGAFSGYTDDGVSGLTELNIPLVEEIGEYAFANVSSLQRITAPKLTKVGNQAFRYCYSLNDMDMSKLTEVGIGAFQYCAFEEVSLDSVIYVGEDAFSACYLLRSIHFGPNVETIGTDEAPDGIYYKASKIIVDGQTYIVPTFCTENGDRSSLAEITVGNDNEGTERYKVVNNCLIDTLYKTIIWGTSLSEIPKDENVMFIGKYAFSGTAIREIIIEDNIRFFDLGAFLGCEKLYKVVIGAGLTDERLFGGSAFARCTNIKEVGNGTKFDFVSNNPYGLKFGQINLYSPRIYKLNTAGENSIINEYDDFKFFVESSSKITLVGYTGNEKNVKLPNGYNGSYHYTLGANVFYGSDVESIELPSWMKEITAYAFAGCRKLKTFTVTDKITSIGEYAFAECSELESVTISKSVKTIGNYAFADCFALTNVTFTDPTITNIGNYAFYFCSALEQITIPETVTKIGDHAFRQSGLVSIKIPGNSVLGDYAFAFCPALTSVEICEGMVRLGAQYIFTECTALQEVKLPNSLRFIGKESTDTGYEAYCGTFDGCISLEEITIPDNVEYIRGYAFAYTGLRSVHLPEKLVSLGGYAFRSCLNLQEIVLPENLEVIGEEAFLSCNNLKRMQIGSKIKTIQPGAFEECYNLTDIYYAGGEDDWKDVSVAYEYNDNIFFVEMHYGSKMETVTE